MIELNITRRRFFVAVEELKIHRKFVRHFNACHFYSLCEQSYTQIIDQLEPLVKIPDNVFLAEFQLGLNRLKDKQIMDNQLGQAFTWYDEIVESLKMQILPDNGTTCRHENLRGLKEDSFVACQDCSETFGWFCPSSPDKCCHYFTFNFPEGQGILLVSGEVYLMPSANRKKQSSDGCLFCGSPQERK